ncbi:MAG TPA: hypothetical protein VLM05_10590, partial [Mycobacteriales bacterium]|nr:hypothetical protein [Mycobacteriales bacterium]
MRTFLSPGDVRGLVAAGFGPDRRLTGLDRLAGGSKKGVYRLTLDDGGTAVLYLWAAGENYWPPAAAVPDDPFTDASGAGLFAAAHAALTGAGVRVPRLLLLDRDGRHLDADAALVEDAGSVTLESLLGTDAAAAPLAGLDAALRRMRATTGPHWGKVAGTGPPPVRAEPGRDQTPYVAGGEERPHPAILAGAGLRRHGRGRPGRAPQARRTAAPASTDGPRLGFMKVLFLGGSGVISSACSALAV